MPHGRHIYTKESDMAKATIFAYPQSDHALPYWKCVLQWCAKCPNINLPDQETYYHYPDTSTSICFHIYHLIVRCIEHRRITLNENISMTVMMNV